MKFTFENPEIIYENEKNVQVLNFSDVTTQLKLIRMANQRILTTTYHTIAHTLVTPKNNISYNLAKRIIFLYLILKKLLSVYPN